MGPDVIIPHALCQNQEDCLLVDAGGGSPVFLAQMEKAKNNRLKTLHAIFVSHGRPREPCARCDMGRTQNFGD